MTWLLVVTISLLLFQTPAWAQPRYNLENPAREATKSGIGLLSGWACEATTVSVRFNDGPPLVVPYGSSRGDTADRCGDTDNGFGMGVNWNELGDGWHTATLLIDGTAVQEVGFAVRTLGAPFRRDLGSHLRRGVLLSDNSMAVVAWEEATQNLTIVGHRTAHLPLLGVWRFRTPLPQRAQLVHLLTLRWITIDARSPVLEVRGWLRTGGTVSGSANEWWEEGDADHQYVLRGVERRRERCFEYRFSLTSGRTAAGLLRLTPQQATSITGCDQDGWQEYPTTGVREQDDR